MYLVTSKLPISGWELVLDNALHAIRSLSCVATSVTFFNFQRRSSTGDSFSLWLTNSRKAYVKRFVRLSKNDPLVDEVALIFINPTYSTLMCVIVMAAKLLYLFVILRRIHNRRLIMLFKAMKFTRMNLMNVLIMLNYLKLLVISNLLLMMQLNYSTMNPPSII